jgi:hypothetical protein
MTAQVAAALTWPVLAGVGIAVGLLVLPGRGRGRPGCNHRSRERPYGDRPPHGSQDQPLLSESRPHGRSHRIPRLALGAHSDSHVVRWLCRASARRPRRSGAPEKRAGLLLGGVRAAANVPPTKPQTPTLSNSLVTPGFRPACGRSPSSPWLSSACGRASRCSCRDPSCPPWWTKEPARLVMPRPHLLPELSRQVVMPPRGAA